MWRWCAGEARGFIRASGAASASNSTAIERERVIALQLQGASGGPDLGLPEPLRVSLELVGVTAPLQNLAAPHALGARGGLLPAPHAEPAPAGL